MESFYYTPSSFIASSPVRLARASIECPVDLDLETVMAAATAAQPLQSSFLSQAPFDEEEVSLLDPLHHANRAIKASPLTFPFDAHQFRIPFRSLARFEKPSDQPFNPFPCVPKSPTLFAPTFQSGEHPRPESIDERPLSFAMCRDILKRSLNSETIPSVVEHRSINFNAAKSHLQRHLVRRVPDMNNDFSNAFGTAALPRNDVHAKPLRVAAPQVCAQSKVSGYTTSSVVDTSPLNRMAARDAILSVLLRSPPVPSDFVILTKPAESEATTSEATTDVASDEASDVSSYSACNFAAASAALKQSRYFRSLQAAGERRKTVDMAPVPFKEALSRLATAFRASEIRPLVLQPNTLGQEEQRAKYTSYLPPSSTPSLSLSSTTISTQTPLPELLRPSRLQESATVTVSIDMCVPGEHCIVSSSALPLPKILIDTMVGSDEAMDNIVNVPRSKALAEEIVATIVEKTLQDLAISVMSASVDGEDLMLDTSSSSPPDAVTLSADVTGAIAAAAEGTCEVVTDNFALGGEEFEFIESKY